MPSPTATHPPPPELLTEDDLVLRRWLPSDAEALCQAVTSSTSELLRWMPWAANGYDLNKANDFIAFTSKAWEAGTIYDYAFIVDGKPAGSIGLKSPVSQTPNAVEIGYWLAGSATGRGLATRAAAVLTRVAFDHLGFEHVQIAHRIDNEKSAGIPRRLGFTRLGVRELPIVPGAEAIGCVLWQKDRVAE